MTSITRPIPSASRLAVGVSLISGSLLALEILYVRLVSILLFPVATYLVISIALLGLGASGGLLSLLGQERIDGRLIAFGAAGFSLTIPISLLSVWFASDAAWLGLSLPIVLALPMFFGGIALSGVFSLAGSRIQVLYFADLIGAGASALLVLGVLNLLGAIKVALLIGVLGIAAAGVFHGWRSRRILFLSAMLVVLLLLAPNAPKGITPISPKELSLIHQMSEKVDWEYQGWSALARVDVLSIPGDELDLKCRLPYKLVTHDGGAPSLLLQANSTAEKRCLIDNTIFGVPYWIKDKPKVLVIGLGGGPDVVAALAGGASEVHGAEVNPVMISIVKDQFAEFVGDPYSDPRVSVELTDGRHMLAQADDLYDVIQLTGVDTTVASLGGNPNLAENYLYTKEAFDEYLGHLSEDGLLSVSFPNVKGLGIRLVALANEALRDQGIDDFRGHVIVGEMTGYVHVLVSKAPFDSREIAVLKAHYASHPTSVYFPLYHRLFGQPSEEFIAYSRLLLVPGEQPVEPYGSFVDALENGEITSFLASQPQTIEPPTDEWPFFFVLDKFGYQTPNYNVLFLTLGSLLLFSMLLMIVPPLMLRRRGLKIRRPWAMIVYFACLGLGFIFVEVVFIQKLSLIVGHPSYSLAITLSALLISSGIGSYYSSRMNQSLIRKATLAATAVAALVILMNLVLASFGKIILQFPLYLRILVSTILVMSPGFFMGIPFPSGLGLVQRIEPDFIPWGWGINATFTVIGTILSLILAMTFGFTEVLFVASGLYIVALLAINFSEHPVNGTSNLDRS